MIFWNRQAKLIIGGKIYSSDDLDFEFSVPFSTKSEPDMTEISIYNLSPTSIASIKKGTKVFLNAGYQEEIGLLTSGVVSKFGTTIEGVDKKTTVKIASGIIAWEKQKVQKTYGPGITTQDILKDLLPQFGVGIGDLQPTKNITYQKGRTVSGRLKDVIKSLAKESGSKFYINQDKVFFRAKNKGNATGFVLSGSTGMIGSPERTEIEKKEGWKVKSLLNYQITTDTLIQIESKTVKGMFRVVKGRHTSDWITEMEVVAGGKTNRNHK